MSFKRNYSQNGTHIYIVQYYMSIFNINKCSKHFKLSVQTNIQNFIVLVSIINIEILYDVYDNKHQQIFRTCLTFGGSNGRVQSRGQEFARAAPLGLEVHQDRVRILKNLLPEIILVLKIIKIYSKFQRTFISKLNLV